MKKDFSASARTQLEQMVRDVENEKICDFTDWLGDRWLDFEEWIGRLNIKNYINNVNEYHKKVIDKNNTTLDALNRIFDDVYRVDSNSSRKLVDSITACKAYNSLLLELSGVISPSNGSLSVERVRGALDEKFRIYSDLLIRLDQWEAYLELFLETCRIRGGITEQDKLEYIRIFETYNQEFVEELNSLLDVLSEEEIAVIKYYIYTAEEPYRSIYLENLKYSIGNTSGSDTGFFRPGNNTINVDMAEEPNNPRGPYTTYFHESGHAIDYNYNDDGSYYSVTYKNAKGETLIDAIYKDVSNNVRSSISLYTNDEKTIENVFDYIMNGDKTKYDSLTKAEKNILKSVQSYYESAMSGAVNEAASDVYGGMTCNIIHGSYGHWNDGYWKSNGQYTMSQSKELWAEYYSYCATGNESSLESLTKYFPNARRFLDEMALSMAG